MSVSFFIFFQLQSQYCFIREASLQIQHPLVGAKPLSESYNSMQACEFLKSIQAEKIFM